MERASEHAAALQLHRQGRLDEAARRYEALLRGTPRDPDLLGLMGIVEQQRGRPSSGAARLDVALGLEATDSVQVRNLNARAIIEKDAGRLAALPDLLARHRPAAPVEPPADGGTFGAYVSLASFAMDVGDATLAGDLAQACTGASTLGTAAQLQQLGALLAALGRGDDLEALAAGLAERDHVAARTLWLRAWPAAEKAKRWDIATLARFTLCSAFPTYRDPRRGTDTDALRVLILRSAPPHVFPGEGFLTFGGNTIEVFQAGYKGQALAFDTFMFGGSIPTTVAPPEDADVVFNNIANAEVAAATGVQQAAAAFTERLSVPVLNPPARIAETSRPGSARLLEGIDGVVIPRIRQFQSSEEDGARIARRVAQTVGMPVILRTTQEHFGVNMFLCQSLKEILTAINGFAGRPFYAVEYIDTRIEPEVWRKFRVAFVDGQLFGYKQQFGAHWNVHGSKWRALSEKRPDLVAEEIRFLDDPVAYLDPASLSALETIRDRVQLDFFGVDFGFDSEGRIVVYEANAAMRCLPIPGKLEFAHLEKSNARIWEAFETMITRRAEEGRAARLSGAG